MTAAESTNAHGDAHAAALAKTRRRAALAAWNASRRAWLASCDYSPWQWLDLAAALWPGLPIRSPGATSEGL